MEFKLEPIASLFCLYIWISCLFIQLVSNYKCSHEIGQKWEGEWTKEERKKGMVGGRGGAESANNEELRDIMNEVGRTALLVVKHY
jgi:hypothetical protein